MPTRVYNLIKDKPDDRDYKFSALNAKAVVRTFYPAQVDLRSKMPTVQDQGALGSCTAHAVGTAFQYGLTKQKMTSYTPSRLFIYYNERLIEGTVMEDSGAYLRDGIKTLNKDGACPEVLWPYKISQFAVKPPEVAYKKAAEDKATGYYRVNVDANSIKTAIASGYPVIAGMLVYSSFETYAVAKTGKVPMPGRYDYLLGGHAVLIVGFNEATQQFIVRNSWGTSWGDKGYFYLPYAYAVPSLMNDLWVVTTIV